MDVQALNCDFLVFSGHKMCGPTGSGVLYGRRDLLEAMPPFMGGGDMIREVRLEGSRWNTLPIMCSAAACLSASLASGCVAAKPNACRPPSISARRR